MDIFLWCFMNCFINLNLVHIVELCVFLGGMESRLLLKGERGESSISSGGRAAVE